MGIIRSQTLFHILPEFIERVNKLFPEIKALQHSNDIFDDGYDKIAYLACSDSSGVDVYFYNMAYQDILLLIDDKFEGCSTNIKNYFNLLKLYNNLLFNVVHDKFNVSVNLIDNNTDSNEILFRFRALNQISSTVLIMFREYFFIGDRNEMACEDEEGRLTYEISLKNDVFYDDLQDKLKLQLSKYVDVNDIRSNNLQEHIDLIQMLKI